MFSPLFSEVIIFYLPVLESQTELLDSFIETKTSKSRCVQPYKKCKIIAVHHWAILSLVVSLHLNISTKNISRVYMVQNFLMQKYVTIGSQNVFWNDNETCPQQCFVQILDKRESWTTAFIPAGSLLNSPDLLSNSTTPYAFCENELMFQCAAPSTPLTP